VDDLNFCRAHRWLVPWIQRVIVVSMDLAPALERRCDQGERLYRTAASLWFCTIVSNVNVRPRTSPRLCREEPFLDGVGVSLMFPAAAIAAARCSEQIPAFIHGNARLVALSGTLNRLGMLERVSWRAFRL
jgi:hypothetical protein